MKAAALERALPVYEPRNLREFARELQTLDFDLFVVASYGRILPSELVSLPELGSLNVHPSLLPRYRGATPIQGALLAGDTQTGVTIMQMDEGMDTGDIVLQESVAVADGEAYGELHDRLAQVGARLLRAALAIAQRDDALPHTPQAGQASVTRPISKRDLEIDWHWSAKRIVDHVRAYSPQPAARAALHGVSVKVLKAHVTADGSVAVDSLIAPNHRAESGAEFERRMKRS